MNILITGGTGFVGKELITQLQRQGHSLTLLTRSPIKNATKLGDWHSYVYWDALKNEPPKKAYEGIDAIINLLGEGVAEKRWSTAQKQKIRDTRLIGTRHLVSGAIKHAKTLKTFISASAIGYYEHSEPGDKTEASPSANTFMGKLCFDWETEAKKITALSQVREIRLRIGVVLGNGGALDKLKLPVNLGLGGTIGSGKQWMNWIHITDLCRLISLALDSSKFQGPYNAVSPKNCTNKSFIKTLGRCLKRPTFFWVPSIMFKLLLGEMSTIILQGQRVQPKALENTGFKFINDSLKSALETSLNLQYIPHLKKTVKCQKFQAAQWIDESPEKVFKFFSDAKNLEKITPKTLSFKIESQSTKTIEEGTVFNYKLKLHGIPIRWTSLITDWNPISSFVDTQLKGPYRVWHHTHRFIPFNNGTLTEDEVYYAPPNIPLSNCIANFFIKRDVSKIFEHRKTSIVDLLKSSSKSQ